MPIANSLRLSDLLIMRNKNKRNNKFATAKLSEKPLAIKCKTKPRIKKYFFDLKNKRDRNKFKNINGAK